MKYLRCRVEISGVKITIKLCDPKRSSPSSLKSALPLNLTQSNAALGVIPRSRIHISRLQTHNSGSISYLKRFSELKTKIISRIFSVFSRK